MTDQRGAYSELERLLREGDIVIKITKPEYDELLKIIKAYQEGDKK